MPAPPVSPGAVQDTTDDPFEFEVARTLVGLAGEVDGVTLAEVFDAALIPEPLEAVTVNEYETPLVKPWIVQLVNETELVEHVKPLGAAVTI